MRGKIIIFAFFLDTPTIYLGLNREYLMKGFSCKFVNDYYSYMIDIAVILGADRPAAQKEMKESLEFEIELAKISFPEEDYNDPSLIKPMKVKELSKKYPNIPWKKFFNRILQGMTKIDDNNVIIVGVPPFFKELEKLIKKTPKKILANYLLERTVDEAISYLSDKIRNRQLQFLAAISGEDEIQPRWKDCLQEITSLLDISTAALYVRKYLTEDSRKSAVDLLAAIKKEFTQILKKTDWMDEKTRKSALEKINAMVGYIGYADELLDVKKVNEIYNNLEITPGDYLRSALNTTRAMVEYSLGDFSNFSVHTVNWIYHSNSLSVNIFYTAWDNSIGITAAALQDFLFNKDRPMYMNFAAIGWFIENTITDSFDNDGNQYDKNGKFVDWWQPETKKKYAQKSECIVQQYDKYTLKELGLNVNGNKTKEENISDNEGLRAAYLAYQDWVKQHGVEPKLPGI